MAHVARQFVLSFMITSSNNQTGILQGKKHFEILDGLRGVAALGVVIFHFMEWVYPDASKNFIGHGFLAVDFFFCLSGFVIGYAYDDRMEKMGLWGFFKARLIRLHPLVVMGAVLGLLGFLLDPFTDAASTYSWGKIMLLFISTLFLVPMPAMEDRYFNLFGLNAPAWSLFWEYIANIVYALLLSRINRPLLVILTLLAACLLCSVAYKAGNLVGGWSGPTFWDGGARVLYSFLVGLLIYRANLIINNRVGFIGLAVLLLAALMMPAVTWNWLAELLVVLLYFPLLVAMGAGAQLTPGLRKLCIFSGKISYPLYMTHYVFIWFFGHYYTNTKPSTSQLLLIVPIATILLLLFAWLVMIVYDIPVRKYLSAKRRKV